MIHERIKTKEWGEETIEVAEHEIERLGSKVEVSESAIQIAESIYRRTLGENFIQNRTISQVAAASLYAACRTENCTHFLSEIAEASESSEKEIGRTFTELIDQLGLEVGPVDPAQYVPRYCSELDLSEDVEWKAKDIISESKEEGILSGKSPSTFAASAVYAASLLVVDKTTQEEIAQVANTSPKTIRNQYQEQIMALRVKDG